ncbi:beta strand repeat-containing protein [Sphingomonas lenta]|uniref:Calcium-binding protein n=1 Tax=Sphingomonas lenta TaxID=1141887 RepID=A0A2A2SFP3_9SPHN|nr:hypothetical protein [Sphingomonas lenta]PAX08010.1 hypothetical protein CKY28_10445 [Sphingomonas lenta]
MASINGTDGSDSINGTDGADSISGLGGADTINGGLGDDTIDGGAGADRMVDQEGTNTFFVDNRDDRVVGSGRDTVITSVSYTQFLTAFEPGGGSGLLEMRAAAGTALINLTGDFGPNRLIGNDGDNVLIGLNVEGALNGDTMIGLGGNDTYGVANAGSVITEAVGGGVDSVFADVDFTLAAGSEIELLSAADQTGTRAFRFTGNEFAQTIIGNFGANALRGGGGADTLSGLRGDDSYTVDSTATVIQEAAGEGADTLVVTAAAANYLLNVGASVELLRAEAGGAAINIGGNEFSQRIEGNSGANILSSGGGGGVDTLVGFDGDDTYRVFATGDVIEDTGGFDTVYASGTSYFLYSTAAVEYLSPSEQAGTTAIYLVGNGASQLIAGNYGDNIINGRGGDGQAAPDTLVGLFGNDSYGVFSQGDVVREAAGQGTDVVYASASYQLRQGTEIEGLSAVNQQAADAASAYTLRGNEFAQTVVGNNAGNVLDGRGGNDTLVGLGGADTFAFTTAPGTNNVDTIQDFGAGDRIGLDAGIYRGLAEVTTAVAADRFVVGTAAGDADDRIIYDQATGRLFYDGDGNGAGAAVQFAQLAAGTVLTAASFVIVQPVGDLPAM